MLDTEYRCGTDGGRDLMKVDVDGHRSGVSDRLVSYRKTGKPRNRYPGLLSVQRRLRRRCRLAV
jgi:hypothetical protein